jgi:hypothetical protein
MSLSSPFVGRAEEIARLRKLHAQRKHVLLVGAEGIGKTALVEHLQLSLPLLLCSRSGSFQAICSSLNRSSVVNSGRRILPRQHELLSVLMKANKPVVFDGLGWTNLKLSSFFECVAKRAPVWICCRSAELWDFGFYKPFLWKFVRVELKPFCLSETRQMAESAIKARRLRPIATDEIERLHCLCRGNPRALCDLIKFLPHERRPPILITHTLT